MRTRRLLAATTVALVLVLTAPSGAQTAPDARPTPWETLAAQGVELRQITAPDINHERMMQEPHVRLLAAELEHALKQTAG